MIARAPGARPSSLFSLVLVLALGAGVSAAIGTAHAWQPIHGTRPVWCEAVPYSMNSAGSPDLGAAGSESVVRQGMDDWTRVDCTGLENAYQGTTSSRPGTYEGNSVIGWVESDWRHDSNAIGVTGPRWARCIVEADMELNGEHYLWTTEPGRGSSVNAYSIVLHEGGHFYGLGHSADPGASMYFAYRGGRNPLAADDEAGICALYPGAAGVDCTVTGCPVGQECTAGSCEPIRGDGTLCSPCQRGSDCGAPGNYCIVYPDGGAYCGRACNSSADCDMGSACADLEGVGQCVGLVDGTPSCAGETPGPECRTDSDCADDQRCDAGGVCEARPTDLAGLGAGCEANDECNSGLCFTTPNGGICSRSCDGLDPSSCPDSFFCDVNATGSCGSGICLAGVAGGAELGTACAEDTDCKSLFCSLGQCAIPCVPGAAGICPQGYGCRVEGSGEACGACVIAGAVGTQCTMNDDCQALICATEGATSYCTDFCEDASSCPAGYTCEVAGQYKVCAPPVGGEGGGDRDEGCGCRVAGLPSNDPYSGFAWGIAAVGAIVVTTRRVRRRRAPPTRR